jgi:hypothetical protein
VNAGAAAASSFRDKLERPVFIVSTPRSGSTLLFETLAQAPGLYSTGQESHWLIEDTADFDPAQRGWTSNRLTAEDARPEAIEELSRGFYRDLRDRDGRRPEGRVRMLEKTPKNALRVPFFDAAFPDGLFVYLYRDVRQTLASMMEAWASGGFRTYPQLPGWIDYPWSLLLVPGWRKLIGQPLWTVVAHQWATTTNMLLDDLQALPRDRLCALRYDAFLASPQSEIERLTRAVGLGWDRQLGDRLPLSKVTVSPPREDKWRRLQKQIDEVMPIVATADDRARQFIESFS